MTTQPNTTKNISLGQCTRCGKKLYADSVHTCSPQVANTNDADREAFESHIRQLIPSLLFIKRYPNGTYKHQSIESMGEGWQACSALHARNEYDM